MSQLEEDFLGTIRTLKLPEPIREYKFGEHRGPKGRLAWYRFDFCWPHAKLAAECDGGHWVGGRHVRGYGFEKDARKGNAAVLDGWRVLHFTTGMVRSWEAARTVKEALGL